MGSNSKIEWCDHTFNPWMGCTKVSDGCKHCYAEEMMDKRYGKVKWGPSGIRVRTSKPNWRKPYQWNKDAQELGICYRVFCASLADVFEDKRELMEWRRDLVVMMEQTPYLQWQLLTKRPENVLRLLQDTMTIDVNTWFAGMGYRVWIGTSVENQEQADNRIPHLLKVPSKMLFLSMEPLLGPVDIDIWLGNLPEDDDGAPYPGSIQWVIVGGESGQHARPMHPDWARGVRDQCEAAGVPFFFKQWGEYLPANLVENQATYPDSALAAYPGNGIAIRVGKKAAGRLLDGREWNEMP